MQARTPAQTELASADVSSYPELSRSRDMPSAPSSPELSRASLVPSVQSSPELSRKTSSTSLNTKPTTPSKGSSLREPSYTSANEQAAAREEAVRTPPLSIRAPSAQSIARQPSFDSPESMFEPVKRVSPMAIRLPKREGSRALAIPGFADLAQEFGAAGPRLFSRSVSPLEDKTDEKNPSAAATTAEAENESALLLTKFFKGPTFRYSKVDFDLISILASSPAIPAERVKTTKCEVSEISGNGKLSVVPEEEQHVFFDESIYVCTHSFIDPAGRGQTEVYFWSGSKAFESAIEDAHLFARKTAQDNSTILAQLK